MSITMTNEMKRAMELFRRGESFFLTGEAGSGKTTFVKHLVEKSPDLNILKVAYTGIAAVNMGGVTINSAFGISVAQTAGVGKKLTPENVKVLKGVDLLIVDEVSMVRVDMLESMDKTAQMARRNTDFMGGIQTIFVGDLLQLPPIDDKLFAMYQKKDRYDGIHFFHYKGWKENHIKTVQLTHVFRQTDEEYKEALNQVRRGTRTQETIDFFNQHCTGKDYDPKSIVLAPYNKQVDLYNNRAKNELKAQGADVYKFLAKHTGFREKEFPVPQYLEIPVGSRVIVTINDPHGEYVNGTTGTFIAMEDDMMVIEKDDGDTIYLGKYTRRKNVPIRVDDKIEFATVGNFEQYPIKFGRAMTFHKSQGCTFDKVYIMTGIKAFCDGAMYVALSRCRTLEGMAFHNELNGREITTDQDVIEFLGPPKKKEK